MLDFNEYLSENFNENNGSYTNVKLFKSNDLEYGKILYDLGEELLGRNFINHSVFKYKISYFTNEYDNSDDEDKESYNLEDVEKFRKADNELIELGCIKGETIFITL